MIDFYDPSIHVIDIADIGFIVTKYLFLQYISMIPTNNNIVLFITISVWTGEKAISNNFFWQILVAKQEKCGQENYPKRIKKS